MDLWPHQKASYRKYQQSNVIFDMSEPGTGKTLVALLAFYARRRQGGGKALVFAPKALLEPAWYAEIQKFFPGLTAQVAYAENRKQAFEDGKKSDLVITNTDAIRWLKDQPLSILDGYDTLILDESSYYKHAKSGRSKAMKKLALRTGTTTRYHFHYRALLSGTSTSNSITDIHHQALILDGGERLGRSFVKFRDAVCIPVIKNPMQPQYVDWQDRPGAEESVAEILKDVSIRHKFAEVMKHVPGNHSYKVYYRPSKKLLKTYNQLKRETLILLEKDAISAVNAAVLRNKLLQVASGSVYSEQGVQNLDTGRTDLVVELIAGRDHSVVFYNWNHQREQLTKTLAKRGISYVEITSDTKNTDRQRIVDEYQAGKYQTIIMHPQSGAHGLTLTRGTATIWMSPNDRADLM